MGIINRIKRLFGVNGTPAPKQVEAPATELDATGFLAPRCARMWPRSRWKLSR
jgi:hypothetical protein